MLSREMKKIKDYIARWKKIVARLTLAWKVLQDVIIELPTHGAIGNKVPIIADEIQEAQTAHLPDEGRIL